MLTTSMPLCLEAHANAGYGLSGHPLYLFYFFTFLSGAFLMLSLIMSIFMSLLAGQLSNDTEIVQFFNSLSDGVVDAKVAPLRLMCFGVWAQFFFWTVWMIFNDDAGAWLGMTPNQGGMYGAVGITIPWLTCFWWVYVLCVGLKGLFKAKIAALEMHLPPKKKHGFISNITQSIKGTASNSARVMATSSFGS
uniref:Uncharacterized protein n=2 Tax=Hemiselmis andersenii TaxID=464988 RepID=A0A7S0TNT5_HEMAN|mmetsp:Transcript_17916/g.41391  ORF Transcript_17916/g.41391 Transcript_17916/m.41391 type:complete len:192 (+) Transcript_17916:888-1463(+)